MRNLKKDFGAVNNIFQKKFYAQDIHRISTRYVLVAMKLADNADFYSIVSIFGNSPEGVSNMY